jgi:predicted MFS family arabinose efflux permease
MFSLLSLGALVISLHMNERRFATGGMFRIKPAVLARHLRVGLSQFRSTSVLSAILVFTLIVNLAFESTDQYWQVFLTEIHDLPAVSFGAVTALTALVLFMIADRLTPWLRKHFGFESSLVMLASVSCAVLLVFSLAAGAAVLLLIFLLFSVSRSLQTPLTLAVVSEQSAPESRATALSTHNLVSSAGEMVAAIVMGLLAATLGLRLVFVIGATLLLVGILLFRFLVVSRGKTN